MVAVDRSGAQGAAGSWKCHCLHLSEDGTILYAGHEQGVDLFEVSSDGRDLTKTRRALPFGAHELRRCGEQIIHLTEGKAWRFDLSGRDDHTVKPGHRGRTTGLGVSPDGERFATGSNEGVRVYRVTDGKLVARMKFEEPDRFPPALSFLDADTIVTAAADVVWWSIDHGGVTERSSIGDSYEAEVVVAHAGRIVVGGRNFNSMGSDTKSIHVFDTATRDRVSDFDLVTAGAGVGSLLVLPEHGLLAVGTTYGPVELHPLPA